MKIGLGVSAYIKGAKASSIDGIGNYTKWLHKFMQDENALSVLPMSHIRHHADINGDIPIALSNFKRQILGGVLFGRQFKDASVISRKVELYHAPDHYIPKIENIPVIATIHDAIPFQYPQWFAPKQRAYHSFLRRSIDWSTHIITVSQYSKEQIHKCLGVNPDAISVVHNGIGANWYIEESSRVQKKIISKFNLAKPYVISVGTVQKRKNYSVLLRAWEILNPSIKEDLDLVIVGNKSTFDKKACEELSKAAQSMHIRWLEHVTDEELVCLVKNASCMLFPSFAEGFGFPVVEAFAVGTPVIASNCSSIPEIAKDAAILLPPNDESSWADSIDRILSAPSLALKLRTKGKLRAQEYSWERAGLKTLAVYKEVIQMNA